MIRRWIYGLYFKAKNYKELYEAKMLKYVEDYDASYFYQKRRRFKRNTETGAITQEIDGRVVSSRPF